RNFGAQRPNALHEVTFRNKFRMLASDQKHVAEPLLLESLGFLQDFINRERDAQNLIIARKTAILAIVDAFVRQIKRREQPNDLSEPLPREFLRTLTKLLGQFACSRRDQLRKIRKRQGRTSHGYAHRSVRGGLRALHERG